MFFFFSSRRRHTRFKCDWSSDVCSSDLIKDIVVVEPTTAGVSVPANDLDLNVAALGPFVTSSNTCTLGGSAISLQRPSSGTATADVCIFSQSGFDTSMTYTVSGPIDVNVT